MSGNQSTAHEAIVAGWLEGAEGFSVEALLDVFEAGMQRILQRAQPTLGGVTLGAIVDRVFYTAAERYTLLAPVQIKDGGISFDDLRKDSNGIALEELIAAARFSMVEFLTVIGHLTAEILTPALHAELSPDLDTQGSLEPGQKKIKT